MIKFKRNRSESEIYYDKFVNSFYKTGFINEDLFNTKDRDFWKHYVDLMTDCNGSSVFESILIGIQEVPYTEELMQKIVLLHYKDEEIHKTASPVVYANVDITDMRIYRLLFISNPLIGKSTKGFEIVNTINKIKEKFSREFEIFPKVMEFLELQAKVHTYDTQSKSKHKDLIVHDITTVLVPELIEGMYYNINGSLRYPYFTELYHYDKTDINQIRFPYRTKQKAKKDDGSYSKGSKYYKNSAYCDVGYIKNKDGSHDNKRVIYVKFYRKFYNPFLIFDKDEVRQLVDELYRYHLTDSTKELVNNTYEHYLENIDKVRDMFGNRVPNMNIWKPEDTYYDIKSETSEMDQLISSLDEQEIPNDEDTEINTDDINDDVVVDSDKVSTINRQTLSLDTLKSLILGYNGVKYYGLYGHMGETLLRVTDMNKYNNDDMVNTKISPRSQQIIKTISSNPDLFCTNNNTNPLDVFYLLAYKKTLYMDPSKAASITIPMEDRFLSIATEDNPEGDYGVVDSNTVKSDKTSGTQGNISILKLYQNRFEFKY